MGFVDRQLDASLAIAKIKTAADAKRLAIEGESVRRDSQFRRSLSCHLTEGEGVLRRLPRGSRVVGRKEKKTLLPKSEFSVVKTKRHAFK